MSDENWSSSGKYESPILFFIYTVELHYVIESLRVFYHCYADDTQIYLNFEGNTEAENKLGLILDKIDQWMRIRRLELNSDKTGCIRVTTNNSRRGNVDIKSVMLDDILVQLSNSVRNLGLVFDIQLNLNEQINNMMRKVIINLINISRIAKFIDKDSKIKQVILLVLSIIDFCNCLYYGLPNVILNGLQMLIKSAARIIVDFPKL